MAASSAGLPPGATPGVPPGVGPDVVTPDRYRQVLGHFCTGVTVISTADEEGLAGFTCQSFAAVSLDPPLVLFCPGKSSSTGRRIIAAGRFCASVLADTQRGLARGFASKAADKFAGVGWFESPAGLPVLEGAHAWVDASVETVHEAGDHQLVLGRVTALGTGTHGTAGTASTIGTPGTHGTADTPGTADAGGTGLPLLFYRGRFTATEAESGAPEIIDTLLAWPRHADWM